MTSRLARSAAGLVLLPKPFNFSVAHKVVVAMAALRRLLVNDPPPPRPLLNLSKAMARPKATTFRSDYYESLSLNS
jgi:hypothetical protein